MSWRYAVLGGGIQGEVIAADLAGRSDTSEVVVVDARSREASALRGNVVHRQLDVLREFSELERAVKDADACVVALPGSKADGAIPTVLRAGTPVVDISFTPEVFDAKLDAAARAAGVPLLRDIGVAPGLSHVLAAAAAREFGGLSHLYIYVGGLPQTPPPTAFRHAVYFNARDLISEYVRPARMRQDGIVVAPRPLDPSAAERLVDEDLGELEAFPSDGLRSLLASFPDCLQMREMTLRWPGHLETMRSMEHDGHLKEDPRGDSPADRTAVELARSYPGSKYPDFLLMEIRAEHRGWTRNWRLLDRASAGTSAMARTTGFTAAAAAHLVATSAFSREGLHPPESLGQDPRAVKAILEDLKARGVMVEGFSRLKPDRAATRT